MLPELIGPHMPLSDIARVIGRLCESVPESLMFGTESNLVNDHTSTGPIFSGLQRCAVRRTHRGGSNGLMQVASVRRERVDVRRPCALIAGLAAGGKAQLVGKNTLKVWPLRRTILSASLVPWKRGGGRSGQKLTAVHHRLHPFASACEVLNRVTALCALR